MQQEQEQQTGSETPNTPITQAMAKISAEIPDEILTPVMGLMDHSEFWEMVAPPDVEHMKYATDDTLDAEEREFWMCKLAMSYIHSEKWQRKQQNDRQIALKLFLNLPLELRQKYKATVYEPLVRACHMDNDVVRSKERVCPESGNLCRDALAQFRRKKMIRKQKKKMKKTRWLQRHGNLL